MATVAEYGAWRSPINSAVATESIVNFQNLRVDRAGDQGTDIVYWSELRPAEAGKSLVCSWKPSEETVQWTPSGAEYSVRTRAHEYGGLSFVVHNSAVYFSNDKDQQLYAQNKSTEAPVKVTDHAGCRYADGQYNAKHGMIYMICEDHSKKLAKEAKEEANYIVAFDVANRKQITLVEGADFYASPTVSPCGSKLAWVQWHHPNMPWDTTEIWVADLNKAGTSLVDGTAHKVAGGGDTSVLHPSWTADNELLYIGDQSNWWNLYHVTKEGEHVNLHPVDEEIGGPLWQFGLNQYDVDPSGSGNIVTAFSGVLGVLNMKTMDYRTIETGFPSHTQLQYGNDGYIYCIGESPTRFSAILRIAPKDGKITVIRVAKESTIDDGYFSVPEEITWKTANDEVSHGYFYPPNNKDFKAPEGTLPPLLVDVHGGPTSACSRSLKLKIQYFTSRGFGFLDVNYRGSTGYGKQYRHRLRTDWGVCDVEDCSSGALHLAHSGRADVNKLCISGGSAGGYTTFLCLTNCNVFKAGSSRYGVADISLLAEETHKFESRYFDMLIAPYNESTKALYDDRSPINHVDTLTGALILFQGDEDKVVPPNQSVMMYDAAKAKGLPCCLVMYEGEQHGFRKAENIRKTMDGEFYFYSKVFGFEAADNNCKLDIQNL